MIWIDKISHLWYYRGGDRDECYCDYVVYPNDMVLQGDIFTNITSGFSIQVFVYSIDGMTQHEDATQYFSFYVGVKPNGQKFFNLRAEAFSPKMCELKCFILRVILTANNRVLFDKFTEHYCQTNCCDIPRNVGIGDGSSTECPVFLNYIQRIYHYDPINDTLSQQAAGNVEYTDIAVLGNNLYARGQYGDIDVFAMTGISLTYSSTISGLPIGQALGADNTYLYIDDGNNIKRFTPANPGGITTVVLGDSTTQGDIFIKSNGNILVIVDNPNSVIQEWANGSLVATYDIKNSGGTYIDDMYGIYVHNNSYYLLKSNGVIYSYDFATEIATQVSTAPQTAHNNTRWNGAAQSFNCSEPEIIETEGPIPTTSCNSPVIQITSKFDCIDNETGLYYGIPSKVLQGNATFSYEKVFNLSGNIKREPRDIQRVISFNCKLQRVESFKPYRVKSQGYKGLLPDWKLDELENMLSASRININDFGLNYGKMDVQFDGGVVSEGQVHNCINMFMANFIVRSCIVRTNFGCGECDIATANKTYLIPSSAGGQNFYTENKQLIGDYEDLKAYYQTLGYTVTDVTPSYNNTYGAFMISGGQSIPPPFYYDYTYPTYLVFGTDTPEAPAPALCEPFELFYSYGETAYCEPFELLYSYGEETHVTTATISDYNNWEISGVTTSISSNSATISFTATNPLVITSISYTGEPIGFISPSGRPAQTQFVDMGNGNGISISPAGVISFFGTPASFDPGQITITNVTYSIV